MPLPDERPRQSVANLIGRFEQQNKRQSLTSTTAAAIAASPLFVPRPSSVVTHYTGDSAKEDAKEKREWPPKLKPVPGSVLHPNDASKVAEAAQSKPTSPSSPLARETDIIAEAADGPPAQVVESPPPSPPPPPAPEVVPPTPQVEDPPSPLSPETPPSSPPEPTPHLQEPSSPIRTKAPARVPSTPSKTKIPTTTSRTPRSKSATRATRTPAKSPPSSFHPASSSTSTPPSQVAKPSTPSKAGLHAATTKPRPSSSSSHRPTPSTPARSKTPSTARPKTPSSAATPSRPKTPSSRLFAPTAASLARAGNLPESPAPPVKKTSLGPGVAERLSKPTASSISKARAPTLLTTPQRGGASAVRGAIPRGGATKRGATPATRGALKPRVAPASTKAKDQKGGVAVNPNVGDGHHDSDSVHHEEEHIEAAHEFDHDQDGEHQNEEEHQLDPSVSADTTATLVDGGHDQLIVQEPEEHEDLSLFSKGDSPSIVHDEPDSIHNLTSEHHLSEDPVFALHEEEPEVEHEPEIAVVNGTQDNLDHIVNFLESKPLFNTTTTFATPQSLGKETAGKGVEDVDVAGEIPDEE